MRLARRLMFLCLLTCLTPRPGLADIDPAEYELKTSVRSEKQRKRLEAGFAADRAREAELQSQEEEREGRRLAAEKAAWEALPLPARLTRTRCTVCHAADNFENQRHNRVGWELVILRMQVLNEAPLATGERGAIAAHLAQTYPATGSAALIEALQQLAVALFPVWFWLVWKIARSRFGSRH
ncbi:MAG: hypothetical protein Q8O52_12165 [Sulfuritalea sp.]|nr:hypothetical protein [Sulfuritalea sp.]